MREAWTLLTCAVLAASTVTASAGDLVAGRSKAREVCQTCHGLDGLSKIPNAPNIAGDPELYIAAQLEAYKTGARQNEMMNVIAQELTEQEIADLSAYFAAIEVTVKVPPVQ